MTDHPQNGSLASLDAGKVGPGWLLGNLRRTLDGDVPDPAARGGERTLGYRYTETILPVDAPVYVLGTVQQGGGIGTPSGDEEHRFVVSHRSEEALGQSLGKTVLWLGVGGIASIAVGVVLLAVGIFVLVG